MPVCLPGRERYALKTSVPLLADREGRRLDGGPSPSPGSRTVPPTAISTRMLENLVHFRQCERVWAFQFGQAAYQNLARVGGAHFAEGGFLGVGDHGWQTRTVGRRVEPPDGTGGEQPRPGRYAGDCSLCCFTRPVTRLSICPIGASDEGRPCGSGAEPIPSVANGVCCEVKPGLPLGPHVRFRRVQTLVREGSPLEAAQLRQTRIQHHRK